MCEMGSYTERFTPSEFQYGALLQMCENVAATAITAVAV